MKNDLNSSTGTALADGPADFMAVSRKLADEKDIGITAAMRRVSKEQPELHRDFLRKAQKSTLEKKAPRGKGKGNKEFLAVARTLARRTGVTMTEAMKMVAHDHPWLYQGDIPKQATATSHKTKAQRPPEEAPLQSSPQPGDNEHDEHDEDDDEDDDDAEHARESRNTIGGELGNLPAGTSVLVVPAGKTQAEFSALALLPDGNIVSVPGFSDVRGPAPVAASPTVLC